MLEIWGADIYRDGGSYGFSFDSDDGDWYEFFLQTTAFAPSPSSTHHPPVIYWQGPNSGRIIQRFTWEEGRAFIAPLSYDNDRFRELVAIVNTAGEIES